MNNVLQKTIINDIIRKKYISGKKETQTNGEWNMRENVEEYTRGQTPARKNKKNKVQVNIY